MSDQSKRSKFFLIRLMFSDSQAKKVVGKKWRIILPVTTSFTDEILCDIFSSDKVIVIQHNCKLTTTSIQSIQYKLEYLLFIKLSDL